MHGNGRVNFSNAWHKGLYEVLDLDPVMILMVFFCS